MSYSRSTPTAHPAIHSRRHSTPNLAAAYTSQSPPRTVATPPSQRKSYSDLRSRSRSDPNLSTSYIADSSSAPPRGPSFRPNSYNDLRTRSHSVPRLAASFPARASSAPPSAAPSLRHRSYNDLAYEALLRPSDFDYTIIRAAPPKIAHPDQAMRLFAHEKGGSIADLAKKWALRGALISDPRGNKLGSCGSSVNRALAEHGLREGQWALEDSAVCTVSWDTRARPKYALDAIRPGE